MKLINSLHTLALDKFIDAMIDQDYSGLVVEGEPTAAEIAQAWEDILYQYNEAMGDIQQNQYLTAFAEFKQIESKHMIANTYIEMLNQVYVPKWAKALNKLVGSNHVFNPDNRDEYYSMLVNCSNRNKGILLRMRIAEMELSKFDNIRSNEGQKPSRENFIEVMVNLKAQTKREIPYTISTYEFCVLVNQYRNYVKIMESQNSSR